MTSEQKWQTKKRLKGGAHKCLYSLYFCLQSIIFLRAQKEVVYFDWGLLQSYVNSLPGDPHCSQALLSIVWILSERTLEPRLFGCKPSLWKKHGLSQYKPQLSIKAILCLAHQLVNQVFRAWQFFLLFLDLIMASLAFIGTALVLMLTSTNSNQKPGMETESSLIPALRKWLNMPG